MTETIKTGDKIKLTVAAIGHHCHVEINGAEVQCVTGFKIEAHVGKVTTLDISTIYPWPTNLVDSEVGQRMFSGYFVERADWEAFAAWHKSQDEVEP